MAKRSKGLGDSVEKAIKATGLHILVEGKDCGCDKRIKLLNKLVPYKYARCFTEEEYNKWKEFTEIKTIKLSWEQIKLVCELYSKIFNKQLWYPCLNCGIKPLHNMIDKLDKVYENYE